jgi:hypothetical protein
LGITRGQGGRVTGGKLPEGRAGECDAKGNQGSPPKEQPPPESLRPKDRARLTVWKESAKCGPPKGQSSQAQRQTGAMAEALFEALAVVI